MRVYHDLYEKFELTGSVVTIGKYDGIHLGHQKILNQVVDCAVRHNLNSVVLTFDTDIPIHDRGMKRITPLHEKIKLIRDMGIDVLVIMKFGSGITSMSPEKFVKEILQERLNTEKIIVGPDFRFGRNRAGDVETLQGLSENNGFKVEVVPFVHMGDKRISSSEIRRLIWENDTHNAVKMLGRSVSVTV